MKIYQPKIDDTHQDAFWYQSGLVAENGEKRLTVEGEAGVTFSYEYFKGNTARMYAMNAKFDDSVLRRNDVLFDQNPWFEIEGPDGEEGHVFEDYDEALQALTA